MTRIETKNTRTRRMLTSTPLSARALANPSSGTAIVGRRFTVVSYFGDDRQNHWAGFGLLVDEIAHRFFHLGNDIPVFNRRRHQVLDNRTDAIAHGVEEILVTHRGRHRA